MHPENHQQMNKNNRTPSQPLLDSKLTSNILRFVSLAPFSFSKRWLIWNNSRPNSNIRSTPDLFDFLFGNGSISAAKRRNLDQLVRFGMLQGAKCWTLTHIFVCVEWIIDTTFCVAILVTIAYTNKSRHLDGIIQLKLIRVNSTECYR